MANGIIPDANWKERIFFLLGRREIYLIEGNSMSPTLSDGDTVLISPSKRVRTGDVVLALHPYKSDVKLIKRISDITDDKKYRLVGDNAAESTDSRTLGMFSANQILGRVVARLK